MRSRTFLSKIILIDHNCIVGLQPAGFKFIRQWECSVGETPSDSGSVSVAGSSACQNPLSVVVGASWTYKFTGAAPGDFTRSITAVNTDGFLDQDVFTSGITRTGEWKCNSGALIALNPNGGSTAAVQSSTVDSTFKTTAMDGVTLPASINVGDSWTQNFTIEGTETIKG